MKSIIISDPGYYELDFNYKQQQIFVTKVDSFSSLDVVGLEAYQVPCYFEGTSPFNVRVVSTKQTPVNSTALPAATPTGHPYSIDPNDLDLFNMLPKKTKESPAKCTCGATAMGDRNHWAGCELTTQQI